MAVMSRRRNLFLFDAKPEYALHRCECSVRCCGTHCESDVAEGFEGAQAARKHVVLLHGDHFCQKVGLDLLIEITNQMNQFIPCAIPALCSHS